MAEVAQIAGAVLTGAGSPAPTATVVTAATTTVGTVASDLGTAGAAAVCAGAAVWLAGGTRSQVRRARLLLGRDGPVASGVRSTTAPEPGAPGTGVPGTPGAPGNPWTGADGRTDRTPDASGAAVPGTVFPWSGTRSAARAAAGVRTWAGGRPDGARYAGSPTGVLDGLQSLRGRMRGEWWAPVAGLAVGALGSSPVPVALGALGVPLLRKARLAAWARRDRLRRGDAVIALCGSLAGEVRAGRQPGEALLRAARDSGGLGGAQAAVLAAARFGGDVPAALAKAARRPGAEGLLGLAACWRVAVDQGAGLAAGLDRLAAALRVERDQRADLRAQLAGARSTAVMLAGLPVLGIALGSALGADPLRVLLHTGAGLGCLVAGGVLEAVGLCWALGIVRKAEGAA